MAPQTRVPSRALIHALRGILFTTSCSVVLLAEERRRRLKLARTALDNARKLHTAKTRRRSVSLIEDRGSWDFVDQYAIPNTKRTLDQHPRGNGKLDDKPGYAGSEALKPSSLELKSASAVSETRPSLATFGKQFLNVELLKGVSSPVHHQLSIPVWEPPTARKRTSHAHVSPLTDISAVEQDALSGNVTRSKQDSDHSAPAKVSEAEAGAAVDGSTGTHMLSSNTQAAQPSIVYDHHLIETSLTRLASPDCTPGEAADVVESVLDHLTGLRKGMLMPKKLLKKSPHLLQAVMKHDPANIPTLLSILLSHCNDTLRLLTPTAVHSIEENCPDVFISMLEYVSTKLAHEFADSSIPYRLLKRYNKRQSGFENLKQLFRMLEEAGFFQGKPGERRYEYSARRYMIESAAEAEDDAFAQWQTENLLQLDAARVRNDVTLGKRTIQDEARRGDWASVSTNLATLARCAGTQQDQLQHLLSTLVQIFAQQQPAEKVETLLRHFIELYNMKMERHWALFVVEQYGLQCDTDGACEWLQYCSKSGLELDDAFLKHFYSKCYWLWGYHSANLRNLEKGLRAVLPTSSADWLFKRHIAESSESVEKKGSGEGASQGGSEEGPPEKPGPHTRITVASKGSERLDLSARMRFYMRAGQWKEALDFYQKTCSDGAKFSPTRFGMAIQSLIELDGGCTDEAAALVERAMEDGRDISHGMKALMLGQLRAGADVQDLLDEFRSMGVRVHDHVFNEVAMSLQFDGDVLATERICHLAAKENGQGDLVYNKHNFANLLFVYSVHQRYGELETLVERFTAQTHFWHGSPRCKLGVKYAMKVVGSKLADYPEDEGYHERALEALDRALTHVKNCRPSLEDRKQLEETLASMASTKLMPEQPSEPVQKHEVTGHSTADIKGSSGQDWGSSQESITIVHDDLSGEAIACT